MIIRALGSNTQAKTYLIPSHNLRLRFCSASPKPSRSDLENQLHYLCGKSKPQIADAVSLFNKCVESKIHLSPGTCTFLVHELNKSQNYDSAISVYRSTASLGIYINYDSLSCLISCFANAQKPRLATGVLGLILKRGFSPTSLVRSLVVKGFCRSGEAERAREVSRALGVYYGMSPDISSFNMLINGFCGEKRFEVILQNWDV